MSDLPSLLPPNATALERNVEQATARLGEIAVPGNPWNPEACPAPLLPWLAWALNVYPWRSDWPEARKRAAIAAAPYVHRHAGTRGGVNRMMTAIDLPIELVEWWETEPQGAPFTFSGTLDITDVGFTADESQQIDDAFDASKNLRSHLTVLTLRGDVDGPLYLGAAIYFADSFLVRPEIATELDSAGPTILAAGQSAFDRTDIYPAS